MSLVNLERRDAAAVITYTNPPFGTLTAAGSREVLAAIAEAVADPAMRCLVLTGGLSGVFVRHYDIGELSYASDRIRRETPIHPRPGADPGAFGRMVQALHDSPKPVIAAINGHCMGGGFELSMACDIRIAGSDVVAIGLPETRIGLFPSGGGSQRLPRLVGEARALEFILLGRVVAAEEALRLGLVTEVVADPLARALEIAARLAAFPAEGIGAARRLVRTALDRPLAQGLEAEGRALVEIMAAPAVGAALRGAAAPGTEVQRI
jgi:enoyl-CoA hydratase/carnithine racemase